MTATVSPRTSPGVPLLAVDVGNSHIRLGLFGDSGDPDSLREPWRVRTSPATTGDELALTVRGLLADDAATLGGIVAQSVVPSVTGELRDMAARHWPASPPSSWRPACGRACRCWWRRTCGTPTTWS